MMYDEFDFVMKIDTDKGLKEFTVYVKSSFERFDEDITIEGISVHEVGESGKFNIFPVIEIFDKSAAYLINSESGIRSKYRIKDIKREQLNE